MDQEDSTPESGGDDIQSRLEAFLSPQDAPPEEQKPPAEPGEPQGDATATDPEQTDAQDQEAEQPEYQLADVARLLGADETALDVDDAGAILVKTKIDGEEGRVKFADLIKSYQLQGHVDKQVREAAEMRKAVQEQAAAIQQQFAVQQAVVDKIAEVKAIERDLTQYQQIDWSRLIDSDPVQAMKLDQQMRALQQRHASAVGEVQQAAAHVQQQQAQQSAAMLQQEHQALMRAVPEWSDTAKANQEKQAIFADLKSRGFSESDIKSLSDHKAVLLARDAMLYRQSQAAKQTATQQVRAAPKIVKPGSPPAQATGQRKAIQNMKTAARSGSRDAVASFLLATGKV